MLDNLENIKERKQKLLIMLAEYGIHNEQELDKALKTSLEKLSSSIGIMTMPINDNTNIAN
jgi:hypothetical protein